MRKKRADDDDMLYILDLHRAGRTCEQIARTLGLTPRSVRDRIRHVIESDCAADPAARDYWFPDTKKGTTT